MRRTNGFKTEGRGRNKIIWGGGERETIGVFKGERERKIIELFGGGEGIETRALGRGARR